MTAIRRPASVAQAGAGPFAAGCTALQLTWGDALGHDGPTALTDIGGLAEARGITITGGTLRIGTLETLERCRTDPAICRHAPLLAEACSVVGALGVRLLGTLGGNIGWRQGDTLPALLALGASLQTASGTMPLDQALALPSLPLLLAVLLPPQPAVAVFEKVGHRAAFSPSVVTVAACIDGTTVRLAASAAGHPARRLRQAEAAFATNPAALEHAVAAEVDWGAGQIAGRVLAGLLTAALATQRCAT